MRIMMDLAENSGGFIPLREIGKRQDVTVKYLEQIISALSKAGLVTGTRGSGGGYMLAKKPSDMTIGDIFRAAEGDFSVDETGASAEFWNGLARAVWTYLDGQTLEDVVKNSRAPVKKDPSIWIL